MTIHIGVGVRSNINLNVNGLENDIAIIKVKDGSSLPCSKKHIWPACLPSKVSKLHTGRVKKETVALFVRGEDLFKFLLDSDRHVCERILLCRRNALKTLQ